MKKFIALTLFLVFQFSDAIAQNEVKFGQSFAPLVEKLIGGVVNISTIHDDKSVDERPNFVSANEFINNYFIQDDGGYTSLGSGFIIDPQGYIVTNNHVIEEANEIIVKTLDNMQYKANVIGVDKMTDLALIKIDSKTPFPYVNIGDSDELKVGDWILAIGNPFGLGSSVTAGIVSAKSRDIDVGSYDNFIQTDASINQGSSGGPMFNMSGEVVGVNTALYSTSGASMGIGFATPINLSKFVISELKNKGKVERGWLGIKVMDNTQEISLSDNKIFNGGVVISSIVPESPISNEDVQAGDILLSVNGKDIKNAKDFSRTIAESKIGSDVILRVWKNMQIKDISLKIAQMPEIKKNILADDKTNEDISGYISSLGIIVKNENGKIVVDDILEDSDAFIKGVKSGNIIYKINDKEVSSSDDIEAYIDYSLKNGNEIVKMEMLSEGFPRTLNVRIVNNDKN